MLLTAGQSKTKRILTLDSGFPVEVINGSPLILKKNCIQFVIIFWLFKIIFLCFENLLESPCVFLCLYSVDHNQLLIVVVYVELMLNP